MHSLQSDSLLPSTDEKSRLEALRRYDILDTKPEESFDRITRLASSLFDAPMSSVSFLDDHRQWFKSRLGHDEVEMYLDETFCVHTIQSEGTMVIEDARRDERFSDHPRVIGEPGLRFYAGVPLVTPDGHPIGTLCVLDTEPRSPSDEQIEQLEDLAEIVMDELELRREARQRRQAESWHRLQTRLLDQITQGASLHSVLSELLTALEEYRTGMHTSILLYDDTNHCLRHGAAPTLPDAYIEAIDGMGVGPEAGCCGTAIHRGAEVTAEDIASDPRWKEYRSVALRHDLRACWAVPIYDSEEEVLGTLATYYPQPTVPSEDDQMLIERARSLASIAIERHRDADHLRLLSEAVEQSNESVLITEARSGDSPSQVVYANAAFEELHGYTKEEIVGRTTQFLEGSETDPETLASLRESVDAGEAWSGELTGYRKDGSPFLVELSISPVTGEEGDIEYWISIQRDVTEEREREEALRRQRNLLEQTQRLAGGWEVDLRTEQVLWSDEVYRVHELSPDAEIDLETWFSYVAPEFRSEVREAFEQCAENGTSFDQEVPLTTAEGSRRWARTVGTPLEEEDGEIVKVGGALQEITQRKHAEKGIREREARLRGLTNSIPGVVYQFYVDSEGQYGCHFVSDQVEALLGIPSDSDPSVEQLIERVPSSHREELMASVEEAVEEEKRWSFELPFDKPSGERVWLLATSTPVRQKGELVFNGVILDLTEQKQVEEKLREERDRFATLFHNLPTPAVRCVGHEERILIADVNEAFEDVFGVDANSAEGRDIDEILVPRDAKEEAAKINRRVLEEGLYRTEVRRNTKSGPRDFRLIVASRKREGYPPEGYAIYTDITERKEHEERLRRTSARLEALFEKSPDMIMVHDTEGNLIDSNPRLCEKTGYDEKALTNMKVWDLDQASDPDAAHALWQEMDIGDWRKVEGTYRRRDGSTFPVEIHLRRLDLEGEDRFMAISRDVSERRHREQTLRQKKRRYQAIFEDPNILVGLLDTDGTVLDINQTAMGYVEASVEEITGAPFWKTPWFTGDTTVQEKVRRWTERAADGEYVEFEVDLTQAVGEKLVISGVFRPVTNENGEVTSLLISDRDITDQKEHEQQLREAKEEAERMNRLKSSFLANMSHEIRTPLTSIIGFAEAIGEEVSEDEKMPVARFARLIEESGNRLLETLNAVLNLSKLEAGELDLCPEPVDLADETKKMAELLGPQAEDAGIDLQVEGAVEPLLGHADRRGVRIALRNLVANAIKYTEEGGIVWVRARREEDEAVLEVEDTGIGIDPDQVDELFEPFRQGSEGTSREYEGTGLGLAVTKQVVHQMQGRIEVDAEEGKGCCFSIHLPTSTRERLSASR